MAAKQRLRDKMREDLELRGMSASTITTYLDCARRFAEHFERSPGALGAPEIREPSPRTIRAAPTYALHGLRSRRASQRDASSRSWTFAQRVGGCS